MTLPASSPYHARGSTTRPAPDAFRRFASVERTVHCASSRPTSIGGSRMPEQHGIRGVARHDLLSLRAASEVLRRRERSLPRSRQRPQRGRDAPDGRSSARSCRCLRDPAAAARTSASCPPPSHAAAAVCRSAWSGMSRRAASCSACLCQSRDTVVRSNGTSAPALSHRPLLRLAVRTGSHEYDGVGDITGGHLGSAGKLVPKDGAETRTDLH